jgi:hypothetical protein
MATHVYDPTGTLILIESNIFTTDGVDKNVSEIQHSILATIQSPTYLIQASVPDLTRYYFKAIDERVTLLVTAYYKQNRWSAREFLQNPTESFMSGILQGGIQLL